MQLNASVEFNEYINPICLSQPETNISQTLLEVGWGLENVLRDDKFNLISNSTCELNGTMTCASRQGDLCKNWDKVSQPYDFNNKVMLAVSCFLKTYYDELNSRTQIVIKCIDSIFVRWFQLAFSRLVCPRRSPHFTVELFSLQVRNESFLYFDSCALLNDQRPNELVGVKRRKTELPICESHPEEYTRVSAYLDWIENTVWPSTSAGAGTELWHIKLVILLALLINYYY